jgi:Mg2+ and Co2+ transporter CorA
MAKKRRSNSISRLLEDIVDDTKDFVDDLTDRARDVEDDLRHAVTDGFKDPKKKKNKKGGNKRRKELTASVRSLNESIDVLSKQVEATGQAEKKVKAAA